MTKKSYLQEPLVFQFDAEVINIEHQADDTSLLVLDRTYFYPTGGGQSHDTGTLADHDVLEVRTQGETVVHVLEGHVDTALIGSMVHGTLNRERRERLMAAHTGQHLLSAAFMTETRSKTLSVKMNPDTPSTVDIDHLNLTDKQLRHVEMIANRIIRENRPVHSYFLAPDDDKLKELRRAVKFDKVVGDVRIVEIDNYDRVACAGTHFPTTGMLGLIKILKTEQHKGGLRVSFAVGEIALEVLQTEHDLLVDLSNGFSTSIENIPNVLNKMQSERQALSKEVNILREQLISYEKVGMLQDAQRINNLRFVAADFDGRGAATLRILANLLTTESDTFVLLSNKQAGDLTIVVASGGNTRMSAGEILEGIMEKFEGRGGGNDVYAQGVIKGFDDADAITRWVRKILQS